MNGYIEQWIQTNDSGTTNFLVNFFSKPCVFKNMGSNNDRADTQFAKVSVWDITTNTFTHTYSDAGQYFAIGF